LQEDAPRSTVSPPHRTKTLADLIESPEQDSSSEDEAEGKHAPPQFPLTFADVVRYVTSIHEPSEVTILVSNIEQNNGPKEPSQLLQKDTNEIVNNGAPLCEKHK